MERSLLMNIHGDKSSRHSETQHNPNVKLYALANFYDHTNPLSNENKAQHRVHVSGHMYQ